MTLLTVEKLSKKFNDQVIFNKVSFTVTDGEHIGLVGKNGSGKTTLFELINGNMAADSGVVTRSKSCVIDYITQEKEEASRLTLFNYVSSARQDLLELRRDISFLENELALDPNNTQNVEKLGQLQLSFEAEGGFSFETEIKTILHGLGFEEDRYNDLLRNFSGGEKNRAGLARVLAGKGNLVLLDEPTNHLDIESTRWLEEYLQSLNKSYIVVSHDRAFLTAICKKIWETNNGKIDTYVGGFEKYLEERAERRRLHAHRFRHQQQEIKRLEEFVRRNMAGQKTKQAQSKLKYLDRIKRLPPPVGDGDGPAIRMNSSGRSYNHVLAVEDLSVGYGINVVVENLDFDIYRGDKIGMIGRNGSGKTTILRSLIGELSPVTGEIRLGNKVDVAYFDQELSDLNPEVSVIDTLWEIDASADVNRIRSFLARFGFTDEDPLKMVRSLSGGEKTKLSLARLLYYPANFIIFDEPTNHLDIDSREALEQALIEYDGSCVIVSHDRYFLDRVVNKIVHVENRQTKIYNGNYSYFKEKTEEIILPEKSKEKKSKDAYFVFKEESKKRSRHKKKILSTRSKIADLEKELEKLTQALEGEIPKSDWEKLHEVSRGKKQLEDELFDLYALLEKLEEEELD